MVRFSRVCLAAVPMCHPQVIKSRQWMRHDGGNTLQYQDPYEGLRALPLKVMECEFCCSLARYFGRLMASLQRRRRSRQPWIMSPKTHHNALSWERWFQERVLGDQWDTHTLSPARWQRLSEKRTFLGESV